MLQIIVPETEIWDEVNEEYVYTKETALQLEHSLVSLSKWESKWCKPFLTKKDKTREETLDYIKCMTLTPRVDPNVYYALTNENYNAIAQYIDSPMTATTFSAYDQGRGSDGRQVTSELIYYWMASLGIPSEYQKWHLNRLITLIKIFNIENQPKRKMGRKAIMSQNAAVNASRRKRLGSRG